MFAWCSQKIGSRPAVFESAHVAAHLAVDTIMRRLFEWTFGSVRILD